MKPIGVAGILVATTISGTSLGDFSGPYAPEQWAFLPGPGGWLLQHTADTLVLQGGDSVSAGDTDILTTVVADGILTFDWMYTCSNQSEGYDNSYYLLNKQSFFLATAWYFSGPITGSESVLVKAGDVIGFRVETLDGVFGPGTLTITNFVAPVPGPGAWVAIAAGCCSRRCRRT